MSSAQKINNRWVEPSLILRAVVFIILITHSVPGMFDDGITNFGKLYLDPLGFAPFGLAVAWVIKLSHVVCAVLLLLNRYVWAACITTIFILVMGIVMVHFEEGWYVVGGGRNGMEYNVLLISVLVYLMVINRSSGK